MIVAAVRIASNLRFWPEGERFDLLMQAGRDNEACARAVVDLPVAAQKRNGMGRLLRFSTSIRAAMRGYGRGLRW